MQVKMTLELNGRSVTLSEPFHEQRIEMAVQMLKQQCAENGDNA